MDKKRIGVLLTFVLAIGQPAATAQARTSLKSICRVKGQEENSLHGLGIVVGLNGTGDGGNFMPTIRSLAITMQLMGNALGERGAVELKDAKNVALVSVTATVPGAGGRQGDRIDCVVSSLGSAKSLAGGRLFLTPLLGPVPQTGRVYALAEGPVTLDDPAMATTGRIHQGCQLEEDFRNVFVRDGKITLVLDENHAGFQVAQDVAESINSQLGSFTETAALARAVDQVNIEVTIPRQYLNDAGQSADPVAFVSEVLRLPIMEPETGPRVVINERAGSIVIGGDVEIGAVVVTHKNVVVETGAAPTSQFVAVDPGQEDPPKLKALVESLNAVHVPPEDIIDIIKQIDRNGKLYADLVIE
jgi:flagellar P-ring protein precursor FlgI